MSWFVFTLLRDGLPVPTTFVETGAYKGNGIQELLKENRFTEIHSIELSPKWAAHCKERFAGSPNVHVHEGDSATVLEQMIANNTLPDSPVIFYLDAHYSGGETAGADRDNGCPVLRELQALAKRNVKGDIVFVDDIRLMGRDSWSGIEGSDEYPVTYFDFRHVTIDGMEKALEPRKIVKKGMCRGLDRMLFVLE
jgi:hypothetical protein